MADGGIGEAALLSAAMGGATSAMSGRDPLEGALLGGLLGGVGGAFGGAGAMDAASLADAELGQAMTANSLTSSGVPAGLYGDAGTGNALLNNSGIQGLNQGVNIGGNQINSQAQLDALMAKGAPQFGPGVQTAGPFDFSGAQSPAPVVDRSFTPVDQTAVDASAVGRSSSFDPAMDKYGNPISITSSTGGAEGSGIGDWWKGLSTMEKVGYGGAGAMGLQKLFSEKPSTVSEEKYSGPLSRFKYNPDKYTPLTVTPPTPYKPQYTDYRMAEGGIASLGGYSDGGRMLKGPGDGMSDSIPARIGGKQEARLADGEFVVPADVVSHLGNGSTDAGARNLYGMMDKVRKARTGTKKQGRQIMPSQYLPA
jgi:hypothetical protein